MGETGIILVVDDDETIRRVLEAILEEKGYIVDTAESGKEAIEMSKKNFYNLSLVDIRLPDIEGTRLLKALKETTPKMVKIIVTGYPSMKNAIEAVNEGADAYILKPFDMENLLQTIKTHLGKQRKARNYSEEKVAEFIVTRAREIQATTRQAK